MQVNNTKVGRRRDQCPTLKASPFSSIEKKLSRPNEIGYTIINPLSSLIIH